MATKTPSKFASLSPHARALRKKKVLRRIAVHGCFAIACRESDISASTLKNWRKADPEFAERLEAARAEAAEALEIEAHRRAVKGVKKPVFHQGKIVGHVTEYSDALLTTLLKGANPEKYGNRPAAGVNVFTQTNIGVNDQPEGHIEVGPERQAMLRRLRRICLEAFPESRRPPGEDPTAERATHDPSTP